MSLVERYSRATRSSDLGMDDLEQKDVDHLLAAGLVRDGLAIRVIRLQSEYDTIRDRRLIKALKSYAPTREAVLRHAVLSKKIAPDQAVEIAERVVDLLVDPNCPPCGGRGFTGGYGAPTYRCTHCRESGKRQVMWKSDDHERFARWLQSEVDRMRETAMSQMRRLLRETA